MKKSKMRKLFGWVLVLVLTLIVGVGVGAQNAGATPPIKNTITILEDGSRVPTSRVNDSATNTNTNNTGTGSSNSSLRETVSVPKATPVTDTEEEDSDEFVLSSKDDYKCDDIADKIKDGKAGALEWIMCPAMDNTRYTATYLDEKIQNWLEMDSSLYSNSSIRNVWGFIRDIANVVMVVFFLLVVASQVTGYGIDNYGIKKMLPRLIAMAIIVNLSLYICQIAVDISNILGTGFRDLFSSAAQGMAGEEVGGGSFFGSAILGMFASAGGVASGVATVTTVAELAGISVAGFWAILVVVLILLLVVLVAAAILLGAVGIRKILVLFCIIISPLAFVMFIFPNMQNLTKKWWSLFKTALIIYPICGLVAGISAFLIYMARGSNSLHWWEIGLVMVLPYLVYFMIPTLVKEALSGLGKIGGALTSMGSAVKSGGKALGGAAMRGASKTQWGQDNIQKAKWRTERRRAAHLAGLGDKKFKIPGRKEKVGLGEKAKFERDVAEKAEEMKAPAIVQWAKDKKAQRYEDRARLAYEGVQGQNKNVMEQATANETAVKIERAIAENRAQSAKETLEVKLNVDRNATFTRGQLEQELNDAAKKFREGDEKSYYRLQAALTSALSRGMDREILNGSLAGLKLSNTDGSYGAKIANTMAGSSDQVVSQFGKSRFKPGVASTASIDDFMNDPGSTGMAQTFAKKGANYAVGMNEDILSYIKNHGSGLTTEQLVKAAANTTNQKELDEINAMLASRTSAGSGGYQIGLADLTNLRSDTLSKINSSLLQDAAKEIYRTKDTDATRQLLDKMNQNTRDELLRMGSPTSGPTPGPNPGPTPGPTA